MMLRHLTRRTLLGTACFLGLLPSLAAASPATDFVSSFGDQLATILNAKTSTAQKREKVLPLLRKNVDIQGIGRYVLGRYWRVATSEQQKEYLHLFENVLLYAVTAQIGHYENVSLHIIGSVSTPAGEKVSLQVRRPHQPDVNMTTVISGNPPKVIDLYGEGASMRMTQRSDYSAYLSRNGGKVQTLIDALKKQITHNNEASAP